MRASTWIAIARASVTLNFLLLAAFGGYLFFAPASAAHWLRFDRGIVDPPSGEPQGLLDSIRWTGAITIIVALLLLQPVIAFSVQNIKRALVVKALFYLATFVSMCIHLVQLHPANIGFGVWFVTIASAILFVGCCILHWIIIKCTCKQKCRQYRSAPALNSNARCKPIVPAPRGYNEYGESTTPNDEANILLEDWEKYN